MMHDFKVQGGEEICTAQRTAGVAALHAMNHSYNISSYLRSCLLKLWHKFYVLCCEQLFVVAVQMCNLFPEKIALLAIFETDDIKMISGLETECCKFLFHSQTLFEC